MLIPWGTDAPIYHWPIATAGMIVLNIAVFFGQLSGVVDIDTWGLALGSGLHPLQWLTHNFLHIGLGHLIGNLIFLWVFGLIVEGKLGFFPFVLLYLAVGTLHGASVQAVSLGVEPTVAVGASAVVYGLMAICLVWAPFNEINCYGAVWSLRLVTFSWDPPIWLLSLLYIGQELVWLFLGGLTGLSIGTAIGHLSGAVWGFLIGTLMVTRGWVDCEGWDLYSRYSKRAELGRQWKEREKRLDHAKPQRKPKVIASDGSPSTAGTGTPDRAAAGVRKVQKLLDMGDHDSAIRTFDSLARTLPSWPPREDLVRWIQQMQKNAGLEVSIPLMRAYCSRYPDRAERVRLKLAQAYLQQQRPVRAQRTLDEIDAGALPADLESIRQHLAARAARMLEEGVLELEGD